LINLHTHTHFSDGSHPPEEYIRQAEEAGLTLLGFSDHSPLPFENTFALREEKVQAYCDSVVALKQQQTNGMKILLGMEVDFIPGMGFSFGYFRENYPLDFLIGSVHLVRNGTQEGLWFIDGPDPATYDEGLNLLFGGDIRAGVTAYYHQINEMLLTSKFEIIGHLDKIKMHNRGHFSEEAPWYEALVDETLALIKEKDVIVEVNTRGMYKKRSATHFPGPAILRKIKDLGIKVIISSDAHRPAEVANLFPETLAMLDAFGLTPVTPASFC
jgi:histidinol-phosphatase (PHP family)